MADARFQVGSLPRVKQQLRRYAAKAAALGIQGPVAAALSLITDRLETDPLTFGEPNNNTRKPGGLVCTAVVRPYFSVTFAAYEQEKVVLLIDVLPLPRSNLE